MPTYRIEAAINIIEDVSLAVVLVRYTPRATRSVFNDKKLLIGRVVPDVTDRSTDYAVIGHQLQQQLAGVLGAATGMMQRRVRFAPSPNRHHQGVGNEPRRCEPTFRGPDPGEVGNPFSVGIGCFEASVKYVGSDGGGLRRPPRSSGRRRCRGRAVGASEPQGLLTPTHTKRRARVNLNSL